MAKILGIFKCEVCGNIVEVVHEGGGVLSCCGQPMKFFEEKTADSSKEKHVPVVEKTATGFRVVVGSTMHPMEEKHYIEWIELLADNVSYLKFLKPGDKPEAVFCTEAKTATVREFCNVHGLWRNA
ncbi:MAG: desulfoferrodoxin [Candidatus Wallbacteria bacterium]|nr:desulfoferrodoxin [Candidatus Wallbacteria bacterium]